MQSRSALWDFIAANPQAGDVLQGTGGCRKFCFAKEGGGKSGGYRVVTWFGGGDVPVFLLTVFAKGRQATLTPDERNRLARITAALKRARKQS
jgi:hypothetical protein